MLSSELLGFPPDARVLIINADDLGMYHAVNSAVIESIEQGIVSSCSLMTPCPWALHAMHLLRGRPEIPFGIHLTLVCDTTHYGWGPLTAKARVPSLLDDAGRLRTPAARSELLARARIDEVETEFRAQINAVCDAGLSPTHLVWHCLADGRSGPGRRRNDGIAVHGLAAAGHSAAVPYQEAVGPVVTCH